MSHDDARGRVETAFTTYHRSFFLIELLALEISYRDDACVVRFPVDDFLRDPEGAYPGGLLATVMDVAMAHLCKHLNGHAGATITLNTEFLQPLLTGPAVCEARFSRHGRSIGFAEAEIRDGEERLVAQGTAVSVVRLIGTWARVPQRRLWLLLVDVTRLDGCGPSAVFS